MEKFTDQTVIAFGKYNGSKLEDIPASYLLWLWNNGMWKSKGKDPLADYIAENIRALEIDAPNIIISHDPRSS
jgi:hypothetical protein